MNRLTTNNILSLFQTTKSERQSFISDVINKVESGEVDAIKIHAQLKKMEDIVKSITSNTTYKEYLINEVEKNGKKFECFNSEFSLKEAGVTYDYSNCNDTEITHLQKEYENLSNAIKIRQNFLKTVPAEGMDILTSDGEVIKIYPPFKSSTTTVNVILK
jgi:hypothetical protein